MDRQATHANTLFVSSARCSWWGDISETANTGPGRQGLPVCPHCRSPLFQHEPSKWWAGVDRYEADVSPGYRAFIEWLRGKCFPTLAAAQAAFTKAGPTSEPSEPEATP